MQNARPTIVYRLGRDNFGSPLIEYNSIYLLAGGSCPAYKNMGETGSRTGKGPTRKSNPQPTFTQTAQLSPAEEIQQPLHAAASGLHETSQQPHLSQVMLKRMACYGLTCWGMQSVQICLAELGKLCWRTRQVQKYSAELGKLSSRLSGIFVGHTNKI